MFDIGVNSMQEAINNFTVEREQINFIIKKFKSQIVGKIQKESELLILGQFIYCLNEEHIEIVDAYRERPDFIIKHDNELIGIEIIEAKDGNKIRTKTTDDILYDAAKEFQNKYPEVKISAWFSFNNFELSITQKNRNILIEEICEAVYNTYLNKNDLPSYIKKIRINNSKSVSFSHFWVGYVNDIDSEGIEKRIKKKEKLLGDYKDNSGIEKQWLLIATTKGIPNSFDIEYIKEMSFHSMFDRVYILEQLSSKLKRLA